MKNKKALLIIGIILLILALSVVFILYKYFNKLGVESQIPSEQEQKDQLPSLDIKNIDSEPKESQNQGTQLESISGQPDNQGGIIICQDKCGDGICQQLETCDSTNLNCTCFETTFDCPKDCSINK